mmetsp:Transcript_1533/g.1040  ORF Transcript_1533/g.1040 Transcript_1533/m.1040 type:complete len:92 (-) Transcript_1533:72-347(-)
MYQSPRKFMQESDLYPPTDPEISSLIQFKCQYTSGSYVVNLQELSIFAEDNGGSYMFTKYADGSDAPVHYEVAFCETLNYNPCGGDSTMAI